MQVLVTGATGRIGSRLVPRLLERGYRVRALVRQEAQAASFEQQGADAVLGDLLEPDSLMRAVDRVDAIIHLAAFFRGATEEAARAINQDGTQALAEAGLQAGVRKFLYVSTNLVYGPGRGRPAREDDDPQPAFAHFYPVSKLRAERQLTAFYQDRDVDVYILRLAFVYGEGDPHLGEAVNLTRSWPPGKRLHMVHHADVAQAVMLGLDAQQAGQQIYNVADDTPIAIAKVRQQSGEAAPQAAEATELEDPWEGIVDTAKIKAELGFHPIYPSLQEAERRGVL